MCKSSMSKTNVCLVVQSCPTLCDPMDCRLPGSSVHRILQARILEWVVMPFSRGSSQSRIEPRSRALQVDSLLSEPAGKPKNTGVGSLSLLQGIFPTRNRTGVSCIACGFFTRWATREAQMSVYYGPKDILARNEELVGESTQNLDFSFSLC